MFKKAKILYDSRFISIIEILKNQDELLAMYLVRLITGFGLACARKYVHTTAKFIKKSPNFCQYKFK